MSKYHKVGFFVCLVLCFNNNSPDKVVSIFLVTTITFESLTEILLLQFIILGRKYCCICWFLIGLLSPCQILYVMKQFKDFPGVSRDICFGYWKGQATDTDAGSTALTHSDKSIVSCPVIDGCVLWPFLFWHSSDLSGQMLVEKKQSIYSLLNYFLFSTLSLSTNVMKTHTHHNITLFSE